MILLDYKGYRVTETDKGIKVENVRDFDPVHVFECGQCFRWIKQRDGNYVGVVKGRVVKARYSEGILEIQNTSEEDFVQLWYEYFDLGRDYSQVKELLCKDEVMERAVNFGHGIRILKQDIWETLISFIISANNRIPRIMKTVGIISEEYGDEIDMDGEKYYSFPDVDKISGSSIESLEVCRGGFRCKYIYQTAQAVKNCIVELPALKYLSTDDARRELMKFPGVGPKVADCVLLYSGTKQDVFPTDVWVKRVMEELYFKREAGFREIQEFAADYFGDLTGFAQQYLFYYARENKIGAK